MKCLNAAAQSGLVVWWNLPACGVLSSAKYDYGITAISNLLAQYRRNGIALVVHANRASHVSERTPGSVYVQFIPADDI